jgi:hypothetical protein
MGMAHNYNAGKKYVCKTRSAGAMIISTCRRFLVITVLLFIGVVLEPFLIQIHMLFYAHQPRAG